MLAELHIRNLAIFDDARAPFGAGLNVVTGETGAGKSLLAGALGLLLGEKMESDRIRTGADDALVEGLFVLGERTAEARRRLAEMDLEASDEVVLRRSLRRSARGSGALNGSLVPLAQLGSFAENLVSIVGQHSHQKLLKPSQHLAILDEVGGTGRLVDELEEPYRELRRLVMAREERERDARERAVRVDFLRHQLAEIDAIAPRPGEHEELDVERGRLRHAEELARVTGGAADALYQGDDAIVDVLAGLHAELGRVSRFDPALAPRVEALDAARIALEEVGRELGAYASHVGRDPGRLDEIEERLARLGDLERKHGPTIEDVLAHAAKLRAELEELDEEPAAARARAERERALERDVEERLRGLTEARVAAARRLEEAVRRELDDLGMRTCQFTVEVSPGESGPSGRDDVRFLVAPNAGEDPKPLDRIASGGELSRILLALACIGGAGVESPVFLFDEVDTGIGGAVAEVMGRKLKAIAATHQVLCITHLPQIASLADHHLRVWKEEAGGRTVAHVGPVSGDDRVREVARMLGGVALTETTLRHAEEMLSAGAAAGDAAPSGGSRRGRKRSSR